jgi:hypothetical protein
MTNWSKKKKIIDPPTILPVESVATHGAIPRSALPTLILSTVPRFFISAYS